MRQVKVKSEASPIEKDVHSRRHFFLPISAFKQLFLLLA